MALTISRVNGWVDEGRHNVRCGYTDITFDDSPGAGGSWVCGPDNFSKGIHLYKVFPESVNALIHICYSVSLEKFFAVQADGSAPEEELDGITVRFYWEGY